MWINEGLRVSGIGPLRIFLHQTTRPVKYVQATQDKIEKILEESGYIIRFERGTFQSGYCILEQKKVVVLNKFLQLEGRINTLIDLVPLLQLDPETLSPETRKTYDAIMAKLAENP